MKLAQRIFTIKNFQLFVLFIATFLMVQGSVSYADPYGTEVGDQDNYSAEDLNASNHHYSWNDPTVKKCGAGTGTATVATGPAADLLKKAGLDANWVNVIVNSAQASGADPLAMAALLFWENRGFPAYKTTGWANSGSVGSGPWQITQDTWPKGAGPYPEAADDPAKATQVAADIVKQYGGVAGYALGNITQDFGKGSNLKTVATLAKNYNAGQGTYRTPSVATWMQSGRQWLNGGTTWGTTKNKIIDDYIVAMTYVYYQIASGQKITYKDNDAYVKEASEKTDAIKSFSYKPEGSPDAGSDTKSTAADSSGKKVIALDPGHAPGTDIDIDPKSNIAVLDYKNPKEMQQMWDLAQDAKKQLEDAGYSVVITKKEEADGTTNLKKRADFAAQNHAVLGVSLHTTPGGDSESRVYVPNMGDYRWTSDGKEKKYYGKDSGSKELADTDHAWGKKMAKAREEALGNGKTIQVGGYGELTNGERDTTRGSIVSRGTVLITDYFATIPWLYNEQSQDASGAALTDATLKKYTKGIVDGIKAIVPTKGGTATSDACGGGAGGGGVDSIVSKAIQLAWPEPFAQRTKDETYRDSATTPRNEYVDAMRQFNKAALSLNNGADCGAFVATVMRASGADPKYPPSYTPAQAEYVTSHPELYDIKYPVENTSDLQPGDVLIVNSGSYVGSDGKYHTGGGGGASGHTIIYLGNQASGYDEASASLGSRSGNQGKTILNDSRGKYLRARLKQP